MMSPVFPSRAKGSDPVSRTGYFIGCPVLLKILPLSSGTNHPYCHWRCTFNPIIDDRPLGAWRVKHMGTAPVFEVVATLIYAEKNRQNRIPAINALFGQVCCFSKKVCGASGRLSGHTKVLLVCSPDQFLYPVTSPLSIAGFGVTLCIHVTPTPA